MVMAYPLQETAAPPLRFTGMHGLHLTLPSVSQDSYGHLVSPPFTISLASQDTQRHWVSQLWPTATKSDGICPLHADSLTFGMSPPELQWLQNSDIIFHYNTQARPVYPLHNPFKRPPNSFQDASIIQGLAKFYEFKGKGKEILYVSACSFSAACPPCMLPAAHPMASSLSMRLPVCNIHTTSSTYCQMFTASSSYTVSLPSSAISLSHGENSVL